jgi:hypothetical protein
MGAGIAEPGRYATSWRGEKWFGLEGCGAGYLSFAGAVRENKKRAKIACSPRKTYFLLSCDPSPVKGIQTETVGSVQESPFLLKIHGVHEPI